MKELQTYLPEKTEIEAVVPHKTELVKIGELRPKRGQRIFELNLATGIINEAKFKEEKIVLIPDFCLLTGRKTGTTQKAIKDIDTKIGCLYVPAINAKNADKKFHKMLHRSYKK